MTPSATLSRAFAAGRRAQPGDRGFTLVELMFTLFIASVLLVLAVPSFRDVFVGAKVSTITNDLMASVQLARSEAIKRNVPITLCRANADADGCDTATDWEGGWIVIDTASSVVLQHTEAQDPNYKVAQTAAADLVFQPIGVGAILSTFTICRATPFSDDQRELSISATGMAFAAIKDQPSLPTTCP